jgi:CheY-like chemotaxis protein
MRKLSILVADDSLPVCSLLTQWLRLHNTACVHTGADALSALSLFHFDLIISDILMPNIDGLEVIRTLRTTQPQVKILAISGGGRFSSAADCATKAKEAGADYVLLKPFDQNQLNRIIESVVSTAEPEFTSLVS